MTASSAPLGVALVGTGFGLKVHLPALRACDRTEVVAVWHRDPVKAAAIAREHGIPNAYSDYDALLADGRVAAVAVTTPPFTHADLAGRALAAGKHLLLEKPTALTDTEARQLERLAREQGLITALDFEYRFVPVWQQAERLLRQGLVGQPYLIRLDWLMSSRADATRPWNWYAQQALGGGALGALGSHSFDYLHWLFGPARRLRASLYTAIATRPDPVSGDLKPVDSDDTALIDLELATGVPCRVSLSSVCRAGRGHWLEVYGDRGTLVIGSANQQDYVHGHQLWFTPAGEATREIAIDADLDFAQTWPDGRIAPVLRVIDDWAERILHGQQKAPGLAEGCYSQLLMELCQQSHRQGGGWVEVPTA